MTPAQARPDFPQWGVHLGRKRLCRQRSKFQKSSSYKTKTKISARPALLLFSLLALAAALYPTGALAQSISVVQRATLSQQPSSSGTITLTLPKTTVAGHALIVGASFWPLDLTSVTDNSGDSFTRGITTSIYHNVSQGVMYTNFYYAKSTNGGATSITLHFTGTNTYVVAAVSEVAGLDPNAPLDRSAYNESLSSASPWSSAALTTSTANEYLFAWAADEWNNPSCSNATSGWARRRIRRRSDAVPAGSSGLNRGLVSSLGYAELGFQLRHGDRRVQGRVFCAHSCTSATNDLDDLAASRHGGNGILCDIGRYRRSFAVHVVCQRASERSHNEQRGQN